MEFNFIFKRDAELCQEPLEDPCHLQAVCYLDFATAVVQLSPNIRVSSKPGVFFIASDYGVTDAVSGKRERKCARETQKIRHREERQVEKESD